MQDTEVNQWNMLIHLSQLVGLLFPLASIIAPLILWQMKKDEDPRIDQHGKEVINWEISLCIYAVVSGLLCFILIGFLFVAILALMYLIFAVIGGIKANNGEFWKYPMTIRFLK